MPYFKERYFENHKIMAVTDKLHKIYRTDFAPVVWARTVGVEVLHELSSLKTAVMLSAGAHPTERQGQRDLTTFKLLTHGVEIASGGIDTVRSLVKNIWGSANNSIFQSSNK